MSQEPSYRHTQHAPLYLLLYLVGGMMLVVGWVMRDVPPLIWLFPPIGVLMLIVAASFHHLTVEDEGDRLLIGFGPVPLFRRTIRYDDIDSAAVGQTTLLDGLGIHLSMRGGWVWNIWGRDCVEVRRKTGSPLWIGTDDADNLAAFVSQKIEKIEA